MYIIDRNILKVGDIILTSANTSLSKGVRTFTKSNYSHAMIWVGGTLIHSDGEGVYSKNVDRLLFQSVDMVKVFRYKEYLTDVQQKNIINFARSQVGKLYSIKDAINVKLRFNRKADEKQFCSRLVAQSYNKSGISLVENPDFCSPEEINNSKLLFELEDCLHQATPEQIDFFNTPDHNEEVQKDTMGMLKKIRDEFNPSIQTLTDVLEYLCLHPEHDEQITLFALQSGYFNHAEYDLYKNPWRYSDALFLELTNNDRELSLYLADFIESIGQHTASVHISELYKFEEKYKQKPLNFYEEHINLYKKLVNIHMLREDVARNIRKYFLIYD